MVAELDEAGSPLSPKLSELHRLISGIAADPVAGSIELLLSHFPPETGHLLRLCAIPHRFDPPTLAVLAPTLPREAVDEHYRLFTSLSDVTTLGKHARFHDQMRGYLFKQWLEPAAQTEFRKASKALADYFQELSEQADTPRESELHEFRAMFHLIGADQEKGFRRFDSLYRERHRQARPAECEQLVSLVSEYSTVLTPQNCVLLLFYKGQVAADDRRWTEAKSDLASVLADSASSSELRARAENRLGIIEAAERNFDGAIAHYERALTIVAESRGAQPYGYRIIHDLGNAYREKGDDQKAQELLKQGIEMARRSHDFSFVANGYNSLGLLYANRHEISEAMDAYNCSIGALEQSGDVVRQADVYNNLGNLQSKRGKWEESKELYARSLEIARAAGDTYGQANGLNNLARVYLQARENQSAIDAWTAAVGLFEQVGDSYRAGRVKTNLGRLYRRLNEIAKAKESFGEAIAYFQRAGAQKDAAETAAELDRIGKKVRLPWWAWVSVVLTLLMIGILVLLAAGAFGD